MAPKKTPLKRIRVEYDMAKTRTRASATAQNKLSLGKLWVVTTNKLNM